MAPPSIRLPLLPPNVFLATLLTLVFSDPTMALPGLGSGNSATYPAPKRTTGGNSNSNTHNNSRSASNSGHLTPGQIAGLVCGVLMGVAVLALVITALLKKDSKGSLNKMEPTAVVRVVPTAAALAAAAKKTKGRSRRDWDTATEVGDEAAVRDEKAQVLVASDSASEVTQVSRR